MKQLSMLRPLVGVCRMSENSFGVSIGDLGNTRGHYVKGPSGDYVWIAAGSNLQLTSDYLRELAHTLDSVNAMEDAV